MSGQAVCYKCGTNESATCRFCSHKKEYVCINCERSCPSHSKELLPNGTNCRMTYLRDENSKKALSRRFPANSEAIAEAREYWSRRKIETLPQILAEAIRKHDESSDAEYKANIRAHITAIQEIIKENFENEK